MEPEQTCSYSKAIDLNRSLLRRYRELSTLSLSEDPPSAFRFNPSLVTSPAVPLCSSPVVPSISSPQRHLLTRMNTFIKITPFNGANTDLSESVDEYLDDVETAAHSWDLSINATLMQATDRTKIRLFRQNLEKNGDAWHWWYYVLPEGDKKDYGKITTAFKDRYGIKATQASSLFAVQNEMLSLAQGEVEHIRDYVYRVEKLSRKIPKYMDSLFAIAFVKGMRDQERKQRVTFDLKDSPNFSFQKALTVVKFSFQEIGEPDPFRPNQQLRDPLPVQIPLYSSSGMPQVNSVSKTELARFPAEAVSPLPALTQEQFNSFMASYEASIGRVPRQTSGSAWNQGTNRRGNSRVTCFNCGTRGHYADTCTNSPVSSYEQQEIRDRIRREREQPQLIYRPSDTLIGPPLSGANATAVTPRAILQRPTVEYSEGAQSSAAPVACVRTCSLGTRDLGNACVVAARIPAVRTIFENALAEKRARVEEGETDSLVGLRANKIPRRQVESGESSRPRRLLRSTNNPVTSRREQEVSTIAEAEQDSQLEDVIVLSPSRLDEIIQSGDELEEAQPPQPDLISPSTIAGKHLRKKEETAPINWMKGQPSFTIQDALDGPTHHLQITLPQLLDCSPRLRRDLAELLRSSVPRSRKKKGNKGKQPVSLHSSKFTFGGEIVSEASPGAEDNVECLYIEAWIGNIKIPEVLVDAGAMLDLISSQLVDRLQLERFPVSGLGMRLADDRLVVLRNYVWLDVVVASVLARIKAYEVAVSQTYQLLLSRRWLRRVKAVEYHDSSTLYIEGSDRVRRKVPAIPMESTGVKMENLDPQPYLEVDDEDAEDAVETLLNELDHWQGGEWEETCSEN